LARAAGQEYMVFTTKHHDGFCMFDSSYTDYKITNTPYGKDVPRVYAAPVDRTADEIRPGCLDVVRRFASPGEIRRPSLPSADPGTAACHFGERSNWRDRVIRSLVEVASRGGNFLLNVGPQPDGLVQPEFQQRLRAMGDWLAINGESIYGTTYGPLQNMKSVRTTAKRGRLFLHIFDWPSSPLEISGLETKVDVCALAARRAIVEISTDRTPVTD
jgi:alpha-L-fucosidase-like protein